MTPDRQDMVNAGGDVLIDGEGLDPVQVRRIVERRMASAVDRSAPRGSVIAALVCLIGGERFGVPLAAIVEVIKAAPCVRVPFAPPGLAGLIVRRGLVYNLVDPASALGVVSGASGHVVLLRGLTPRIALRVGEAIEAIEIGGAGGDDGGMTRTHIDARGARVELIEIDRLVAQLTYRERARPT